MTTEMLNWYKIYLSSDVCFEQRQLLSIPDKAVQNRKSMETKLMPGAASFRPHLKSSSSKLYGPPLTQEH